jgi:WD40 repeat protein
MVQPTSKWAPLVGKGLALMLGLMAVAGLSAQDAAKTDRNGDPLPAGALARFGTLRWRHGDTVTFVAFLPGGKAVLTASADNTLRLWDKDTGKELRRFNLGGAAAPVAPGAGQVIMLAGPAGRGQPIVALSKDGKKLATAGARGLQLWDVETGKEIRELKTPNGGVSMLLFAPDSKTLAVRGGGDRGITLIDTETGNQIRQLKNKPADGGNVVRVFVGNQLGDSSGVAFAPDGKTVASSETEYDQQKMSIHTFVKVTEVASGNEVRRIDVNVNNNINNASAIAYAPDGKTLAIGSGNTIHLRDPDTGKEIRQFSGGGGVSTLVFSPDSQTLAGKGFDNKVRLWEAASGKELHVVGGAPGANPNAANLAFVRAGFGGNGARDLAFSPDGKTVAVGGGNAVRLFDTATGQEQPLAGGHHAPISAVRVAQDGKTMLSRGGDGVVRRWDLTDGRELGQFREPAGTVGVAFSPDGKTVAFGCSDASIRLYDAETGKQRSQVKGHNGGSGTLTFSPDGKFLASHGGADNTIRIHSVAGGTEVQQIVLQTNNPNGSGTVVLRSPYLPTASGMGLAFSPDNRTVVVQIPGGASPLVNVGGNVVGGGNTTPALRIWDIATGKEVRKIPLPNDRGGGHIAVSPDGRMVASENADQTVSLWEIASGKERGVLGTAQPPAQLNQGPNVRFAIRANLAGLVGPLPAGPTLAFSPDGGLLACKGVGGQTVRIWEVGPGKELGLFKGHEGSIATVAFTPDGRRVVSGSSDTTLLLWNVAALKREAVAGPVELPPAEVTDLWATLVGDDAVKAFQGIRKLAGAPKQAVPLIREHIRPAVPVDPQKLAKLLGDLDSDEFEERSAASDGLEKLGDLAVPALQKTLNAKITLETRRRIEMLLARLTGGALTHEQVRLVRAVEVLERTGTAEARQLLEALANGAPGALPTRHAQAALDRLGQKTAQP